ncbi:MAG TPA: hypothetical protein VGL67_05815 [Casimicrobiaceae bacterium]
MDWPLAPGDPDAWLPVMPDHADVTAADAVIESIEESDADARFVPDWSDESFRNAA